MSNLSGRIHTFGHAMLERHGERVHKIALDAGFQTTVLPMSAGAVGRFPPMAVKLNGVTAYTNPSSGRYSTLFHVPWLLIGCSL